MDAAHELGHLVLHRHLKEKNLTEIGAFKEIERQAFYFAGAFLLPERAFHRKYGRPRSMLLLPSRKGGEPLLGQ